MFDIQDTKSFKDSVHGYINIPRIFVKELIDTPYFQRLRNIDQTGMRILYPDAKHDRYGHSLGVFHLGCKAVDAMLDNFSRSPYWHISSKKADNYRFWAKNKVLFLIACLLHDIGHAPFSHSLEELFTAQDGTARVNILYKFGDAMRDYRMKDRDDDIEAWIDKHGLGEKKGPATHEMMGALLVMEEGDNSLNKHIKNIFAELIKERFPRPQQDDILYAEHHRYDATITELDREDFRFIARMITGVKYRDCDFEKQIRNCFIELLNGSIFDVDQLDYIMRDTQMSGINNISIDVDRLLSSINIVHSSVYKGEVPIIDCKNKTVTELVFKPDSENSHMHIVGYVRGNFIIPYGYKVNISNESTFERLSGSSNYAEAVGIDIDEGKEKIVKFTPSTTIICNGVPLTGATDKQINQLSGVYYIENACVKDESGFNFALSNKTASMTLSVRGFCNIEVERNLNEFDAKVIVNGNMLLRSAKIEGSFSKLRILDNDIAVPSEENKYTELSVGYHKQAMNIIANVIEARNYLYLWIYAHHKVVYYANFLLPCIAKNITDPKNAEVTAECGLPQTELLYENLSLLDDSYMWTLIRRVGMALKVNGNNSDLRRMCEELLSRRYISSLFKSFAEFDLLFALYSDSQMNDLCTTLFLKIDKLRPFLENTALKENTAGYLDRSTVSKINQYIKTILPGNENTVKNIVIVKAEYKEKLLKQDSVYVVMRDEVTTMDQIPSLYEKKANLMTKYKYFYVYYETKRSDQKFTSADKTRYKRAVKNAFKMFCDNLIGLT